MPAKQQITNAAVDMADHATQIRKSIMHTADRNMQTAGSLHVMQKNRCVPYTSNERRCIPCETRRTRTIIDTCLEACRTSTAIEK